MSLRIRGVFLNLLQTQREIVQLLGSHAFLTSNLPIVVKDNRDGGELEVRRELRRVNDFVDGTAETQVGVVPEQPDQRIVDVAGIVLALRILLGVRRPAK